MYIYLRPFALSAQTNICEDYFEGGSWLLVRRVKQGNVWHPATDNLGGTAVYGVYGPATSDVTFSIAWSTLAIGPERLFMTGLLSTDKIEMAVS